MKKRKREYKVN